MLSTFEDIQEDYFMLWQCRSNVFVYEQQMWNVFEGIWIYMIHVDRVEDRRLVGCDRLIIVRSDNGRVGELPPG